MLALSALAASIGLGCRPAEQIKSYSVPKETNVEVAAVAPANVGEPTDRMLAAILPAGDQAWFFKAVGPIAAIDKREKEINDFFVGLSVADDGRAKWNLPAGWKEEAGNAMRAATIVIPSDVKPLEISVNVLPWRGTQESLLSNVNRWRGQLQLPEIGPQQLADVTREAKAGERPITIVDLRGRFKAGGMMAPFAGGAVGTASRAAQGSPSGLPAGHPPIDEIQASPPIAPPANTTLTDVPKFEAPAGWRPLPADEFRKAAFEVGEGEQKALVTVSQFASNAGPKIADPLENVNRWRHAIGLERIEQDALTSAVESIDVDGHAATFAKIVPDAAKPEESKIGEATFAAMVPVGEQIWFFKLSGDRNVVAAQKDAFTTFLKSVRFAAGGGAPDGNN